MALTYHHEFNGKTSDHTGFALLTTYGQLKPHYKIVMACVLCARASIKTDATSKVINQYNGPISYWLIEDDLGLEYLKAFATQDQPNTVFRFVVLTQQS